ncbi:TylF/MycF/NovP-related O-methyltransferase [Bosea sp. 2YAB26]|uniref:TylF/MycF/NovP-related O-methyltransferase n=1 Tax=Bosea sp. 2YAB26 TaxID=3237478 RepID=UPI003F914718
MSLKHTVRDLARSFGFDIRRMPHATRVEPGLSAEQELATLRERLALSESMRQIHRRDTVEIEDLLRLAALPDLPKREGREVQLADLIGTNVCEGLYLLDALHKALRVPGDVCEFGVAQGATSQLIASEIMNTDRVFWLFDSFEGLPAPTKEDRLIDDIFNLGSMAKYQGTMMSPETEVLGRLDKVMFPRERLRVMKGWVNESIKRPDVPKQVAFAYLDFDFYEPIKDGLYFLNERMAPGAHVVVDDYGFFSEGAQLAVDEFVKAQDGRWKLSKPLPLAGHFVTLEKLR